MVFSAVSFMCWIIANKKINTGPLLHFSFQFHHLFIMHVNVRKDIILFQNNNSEDNGNDGYDKPFHLL